MAEYNRAAFDTGVAHIARVYNYWLGGKDNYAADREVAEKMRAADPAVSLGVRSNRAFLGRAVEYLVKEAGIRQFLDIGTGIPSANNTHEVAQRYAPESRIVYVDNDPIVLSHARALLASNPAGVTDYIDADLRDTKKILDEAANTLDFSKPIAVMLIAIFHCIPDADDPAGIARTLMNAVPPGSYLAITHPASDIHVETMATNTAILNRGLAAPITFRSHEQVTAMFGDLELLEPGVVRCSQWRPGPNPDPSVLAIWGGVARKPA
jgi:hypothetical protein